LWRNRRGQSLVEYGILVGAIAVVCLAATSILGHKVNDLIAIAAAVLPGHDEDTTGTIFSGKLVQTTGGGSTNITLGSSPGSLTSNLGISSAQTLVTDSGS
jgi:Flp pilus assembly pilin Flp